MENKNKIDLTKEDLEVIKSALNWCIREGLSMAKGCHKVLLEINKQR